jgi:outer membrane protein insertion porin family
MYRLSKVILIVTSIFVFKKTSAQTEVCSGLKLDYENPAKFVIGAITVTGTETFDQNLLTLYAGLAPGQTISVPGDDLRKAVDKIWKQKLFSNVEIKCTGIAKDTIYLNINVSERPKISKYSLKGLKKNATKNLREELTLKSDQIITENLVNKTKSDIRKYFEEKGYYNVDIRIYKENDTLKPNHQILRIIIDKGKKVKLENISIAGNENISDKKLLKLIKPKKKKGKVNIFASSKFIQKTYDESKPKIITKYTSLGYRDVKIVYDSVIRTQFNKVEIRIKIEEGNKFYFRKINWVGNTKFSTGYLDSVLNIKKGDIFDQSKLDTRLFMNPMGVDISSLYMDDGYLFFNLMPIEVLVEKDSIDIEIRIHEGKQATVERVFVTGNDKTSDKVVMRMLRTKPGQKFSRADIQRSMRELAQLGYFDPEQLDVNPIPNAAKGTVDIEYKVVEKPSDQIEASGGWGGFGGFVGTIGLSLTNFSSKKIFEKGGWNPIPAGDGQRLSVRAQSSGFGYQGYNFSFTEPWLGGKKPNSFTFSLFHSVQSNGRKTSDPLRSTFATTGGTLLLGKLLQWPDDYFTWSNSLTLQRYRLNNWSFGQGDLGFDNGFANNLSFSTILSRNSVNEPIYPRSGSIFNLSVQFTPPYSAFNPERDYAGLSPQDRFRWVEYHKWKFDAYWFVEPVKKLVITPQFRFGMIGLYNQDVGYSPFEQFRVGGSGLVGFTVYGTDIVSQRGYSDGAISDPTGGGKATKPIYSKYTIEMRYPFSLNPSATIYGLTFVEAGNAWSNARQYNPFDVKRAAGVGIRLFLPMFGLLGFDYAWGYDKVVAPGATKGQFHFFLGQQF